MVVGLACGGEERTVVIPEGTDVVVRLESTLSTGMSRPGDTFRAATAEPVQINGETVIPAGTPVQGRLTEAVSGRRAKMTLAFETIEIPPGDSHGIEAQPIELVAKSDSGADAAKIVGGGALGAVIGGVAGGTEGVVIGGVLGAAAGTVAVALTSDRDIELAQGQRVALRFSESTELPVPD
jgi:hypothetical protein